MNTRYILTACVALGLFVGAVCLSYTPIAEASRNSAGTYSLPGGNPVVSGTTISSTWANNTLSDISTELTNSLDRGGRGAMTAPLQHSSGTINLPGVTFSAQTNSGLYRAGTSDLRMTVNATDAMKWTAAGVTVPGTLGVTGAATMASTLDVTGNLSTAAQALVGTDTVVDNANANAGTVANTLRFGGVSNGEAIGSKRTAGGNQFGLDFYTGSNSRMSILNSGGVKIPGETDPHPGSVITGSYGNTYVISFGSLTAGTPVTSSQTLSGVSVGGVCDVSVDGNIGANSLSCYVSASNTIIVKVVPVANNTLGSGSYRVRVWQP